jgi:plasmid stability protein
MVSEGNHARDSDMPSITLKNIPETLHQRLRESAERNHRSINGEMLAALDQYVSQQRPNKAQLLTDIRTLRQETALYVTEEEIDRAKKEGRP